MAGDDIALGDGKQAGEPGLGGEQVVATGIEPVIGQGVTDGEQLALGIEQEREVHPHGQRARRVGDGLQPQSQ
ncbi:hypothetical protein D3C76_1369500 [compost metagenome]